MRKYIDIINEDSEPMVVLQFEGDAPQEPIPLGEFFNVNFHDEEDKQFKQEITRALSEHGSFVGGGGASPTWKITLVR
jgi:hypothetical protein